jgi:hypothetical protein
LIGNFNPKDQTAGVRRAYNDNRTALIAYPEQGMGGTAQKCFYKEKEIETSYS